MKLPKTTPTGRGILLLATPLVATLALTSYAAPASPGTAATSALVATEAPAAGAPVFTPSFIQTATDPIPIPMTARTPNPAAPQTGTMGHPVGPNITLADDEIDVHGAGLYRLALGTGTGPEEGKEQFLICMFHDSPGDVAICKANIPVRWKELDGQHRQANRVVISQDDDGLLDVRADNENMMTIRVIPTDVTDKAIISGLYVSVDDNEARFSTSPEEIKGSVLVTPDSYEIITESPSSTTTTAARVRHT